MIDKTIVDLLAEDDIELPADEVHIHIDDTFVPRERNEKPNPNGSADRANLSTKEKLRVLDWVAIDGQIRSFGASKLDELSLRLISEETRKRILDASSDPAHPNIFDFRSDSVPFAVKYNLALALSYSEAIGILSEQDVCEVYASEEVKKVFRKYGYRLSPGLSKVEFSRFPLEMKKELVWPIVQNTYRGMVIRKAAKVFPEGVSGEIAYKALSTECGKEQLAGEIPQMEAFKYYARETVSFSDPSDLEVKYHIAAYCLNHVGDIKPEKKPASESDPKEEGKDETPQESTEEEKEEQHDEEIKTLEDEYIAAFKRLNKNKSFWDRINLTDLFEMGQDVITAIKEEIRNFALLKQEVLYRLAGRSKVAVENEELLRIVKNQNPDFDFASQYLAMFFQPSSHYTILGLNSAETVTEKDIKRAFKRQAKIYHPDKNSDDPNKDQKEQMFKLLIEAKDALLNKLKAGEEAPLNFQDNTSLIRYLGKMSRLFGDSEAGGRQSGIQ